MAEIINTSLRVLLADDHSAVRKGTIKILSREFPSMLFTEANDVPSFWEKFYADAFNLVILDIEMPGGSAFDILLRLKAENNKTPVLIFSFFPEDQMGVRSLELGARGYLSKSAVDMNLVEAVQKVLSGRKYVTPELSEKLVEVLENPANKNPHEQLSMREYETFIKIASGKSISEIAKEFALSVPTISTYKARILEKMRLQNTAEIINYAVKNNLVA